MLLTIGILFTYYLYAIKIKMINGTFFSYTCNNL